jgi:hypothetical protein
VEPQRYAIVVKGELSPRYAAAFERMELTCCEGKTRISGPVADQAQLRGLLDAVDALGLELVSVEPLEELPAGSPA